MTSGAWWVRLTLTVAVLAYLLSRIGIGDTLDAVRRLDAVTLAAIAGLTAVDRWLMAWRWILLVRGAGVGLTLKSGLWIFLVSSFLGSLAPSGVGGDIARVWELGQRTARAGEAVASVAVDRWLGLASVVALGVFGLANWSRSIDPRIAWAMHGLLLAVVAGSVAGLWADRLLQWCVPAGWLDHRPGRLLLKSTAPMALYRRQWPTLSLVAVLSVVVQVLRVVLAWVIGRGLGIDVGLDYYLVVMPIGIVMILLPISIGGFGPAQGVIVWLLRPMGVPDALSFVMSTLFILAGLLGNLPGALLYLTRRH